MPSITHLQVRATLTIALLALIAMVLVACGSQPAAAPSAPPSATAVVAQAPTVVPTDTSVPPTNTAEPSPTLAPSDTPTPSATATTAPTTTATPNVDATNCITCHIDQDALQKLAKEEAPKESLSTGEG